MISKARSRRPYWRTVCTDLQPLLRTYLVLGFIGYRRSSIFILSLGSRRSNATAVALIRAWPTARLLRHVFRNSSIIQNWFRREESRWVSSFTFDLQFRKIGTTGKLSGISLVNFIKNIWPLFFYYRDEFPRNAMSSRSGWTRGLFLKMRIPSVVWLTDQWYTRCIYDPMKTKNCDGMKRK